MPPSTQHDSQPATSAQASTATVFLARLRNPQARPLLLDGALGTELERRGLRSELPLWSTHALLEAPDVVREIHAAYLAAGAEILTANTFRTQRRTLRRCKLETRARELSTLAIALARDAIRANRAAPKSAMSGADLPQSKTYLVLGSNPPLEDCFHPELVPDAKTLDREHLENIATLLEAGADGVLIETMNSIREAVAATRAAQHLGALTLVSFCATESGTPLSGEKLADALEAVAAHAPHAVLVNCLPATAVRACLPILADTQIPFGVYANNLTLATACASRAAMSPAAYAHEAEHWLAMGARIIGGCCGTMPAHIAALAALLR